MGQLSAGMNEGLIILILLQNSLWQKWANFSLSYLCDKLGKNLCDKSGKNLSCNYKARVFHPE